MGIYPNALFPITQTELEDFISAVEGLGGKENNQALLSHFGSNRNDPDFWTHSDAMQTAYHQESPIEAKLFHYHRLENRYDGIPREKERKRRFLKKACEYGF